MNTDQLYRLFQKFPSVHTDSRKKVEKSIFFALKGDQFNGNKFAAEAIENGASVAVVDEEAYCQGNNCILVPDSLTALQELSALHRKQLNIPVIGITGTNGKTTTKELLYAVLSKKYKVAATAGNLNNHIGVPLTLLSVHKHHEIAIIEMGANHPGEIEILCQMAMPDFGIITNIGKAHLEGFGSIENIINTKTALYRSVAAAGGSLFVPSSQAALMKHAEGIKRIVYGQRPTDDCRGAPLNEFPFIHCRCEADDTVVRSQLTGEYNFENILAAVCIGRFFKVDEHLIREAVAGYAPSNMRSQVVSTSRNTIILDAYNANPTSMEAALNNLGNSGAEKKTVILGDMLELGNESASEHKRIVQLLSGMKLSQVLLVGPQFSAFAGEYGFRAFQNTDSCIEWMKTHPVCGSLILLKGSRGMKMEKISDIL